MHLFVIARGHYTWLVEWVHRLQSINLPYKYAPDKSEGLVQLAVRPYWPMEIIFPEPCLEQVLSIVRPYDAGNTLGGKHSRIANVGGWAFNQGRKIAGLEKIPEVKASPMIQMINPQSHVGVIGMGLKKDVIHPETGIEML